MTSTSISQPRTEEAVERTECHLEREQLRGWDPYDGLTSPLFRLPVLRSNRLLRFAGQQLIKRSRWNVRPLLRIPKQLNPVAVGLYLQGQAQLASFNPSATRERKAQLAVEQLASCVSPGFSGSCWGYPFDWETRYGSIPAGTPTVVATGMITNALLRAYQAFGIELARELVLDSANFVLRDLNRIESSDGTFCWSYSPLDRQAVLNATMKGSRLLAQASSLGAPETVLDPAASSARFVAINQAATGAWPYAIGDARRWADHFHTGYILDCLSDYRARSGDGNFDEVLARGWTYYRKRFFTVDLVPKYYDDRAEPLDATACAQAIITLCEFGDIDAASAVANHALGILGLSDGSFAYQQRRERKLTTPFLRWSTAWMYCGLTKLCESLHSAEKPPTPVADAATEPAL